MSSLVLVNPGLSGYRFTGLDRYTADVRAASERNDLAAFVEVQVRMWFDGPSRTPDQVDDTIRERVRRILTEQAERNRARRNNPAFRELNAAARLAEIDAPTLVVESALDQADIHAICDLVTRDVRGARRVIINGAAHLVNLERPREFADAVHAFLASVERDRASDVPS